MNPADKPTSMANRPSGLAKPAQTESGRRSISTTPIPPDRGPNPSSPKRLVSPPNGARPLIQIPPYFEIRSSAKGGYGAFALEDIPPYTPLLAEPALLQATSHSILEVFKQLPEYDQQRFMDLASFDLISPNKIISIFKTNR